MKTVVQIMRDRGWTVALAAPTGRAAQRLSELVGAFGDDLDNHGEYRQPYCSHISVGVWIIQ
jgi:hypothetical protein